MNSTIIKKAMMVTLFLVFLEDCLGFEWKNLRHGNAGMWNKDDVNIIAVKESFLKFVYVKSYASQKDIQTGVTSFDQSRATCGKTSTHFGNIFLRRI